MSVHLNTIVDKNYNHLIENLHTALDSWKKRHLTPYGKITVIKTFIISKFIHLFTTLPDPNPIVLNKMNSSLYKFIWDGKPDKIKRTTLTSKPSKGGLKMIDLPSFVNALKLSWVKRFLEHENSQWKHLVNNCVINIKKFIEMGPLWHTKIRSKVKNPFWRDVLSGWVSFHRNFRATSKEEALCTGLWNNPNVVTNGMINENLYRNGCVYIADLCDCSYKVYDVPTIKQLYQTSLNFLEYYRLSRGINNYLKKPKASNTFARPFQPLLVNLLSNNKKGSRVFYDILSEKNDRVPPNFIAKWSRLLGTTFSDLEWKRIFNICNRTIIDNEIKWFQYKIIHKILGTNSLLFKIAISDSNLCRFCKETEETDYQLFYNCQIIKNLREELCLWTKNLSGNNFGPTDS